MRSRHSLREPLAADLVQEGRLADAPHAVHGGHLARQGKPAVNPAWRTLGRPGGKGLGQDLGQGLAQRI